MSKPGETDYGKGSFQRSFSSKYRDNYDAIFGKKPPEAPATKPKVCLCSQRLGTNPNCSQHPGFGSLGEYLS